MPSLRGHQGKQAGSNSLGRIEAAALHLKRRRRNVDLQFNGLQRVVGDQIMCQTNGYVRGLAKHQHYLYIGQSTMRRLDRFANRFNNISLDCGILVWNIDNKTSRFVSLPAKSVFDILVLETD